MIVGDLAKWEQEKRAFHPAIAKGVEFLRTHDLAAMELGRYEVEGSDLFVLIQEAVTEAKELRKPESHVKYIDIQYLIEGTGEIIGAARHSDANVISVNDFASKDIAFYSKVENEFDILLRPGMFAVFFPNDVHRPVVAVGEGGRIKKAVVKINKALLEA